MRDESQGETESKGLNQTGYPPQVHGPFWVKIDVHSYFTGIQASTANEASKCARKVIDSFKKLCAQQPVRRLLHRALFRNLHSERAVVEDLAIEVERAFGSNGVRILDESSTRKVLRDLVIDAA